ncbi:MAG: protein translocase subunit SecD [Verrucomicrobiota bacterium]
METKTKWKWLIVVLCIAVSGILVWPPGEKIRLGLDLEGGTSLIVAVDDEDVAAQVREKAPENLAEEDLQRRIRKEITDSHQRALEVIRNRVDQLGIAEPVIFKEKGSNRIVIQLPGADKEKREEAIRQIQRVAFLAFHLVHKDNSELAKELLSKGITPEGYQIVRVDQDLYYRKTTDVLSDEVVKEPFRQLDPPLGYKYLLERMRVPGVEDRLYRPAVVKRRYELSGDSLEDAHVEVASMGSKYVTIDLDREGARDFENITRKHTDRQLAIVLDDVVYSSPMINEVISGGSAMITGNFPGREADRLAMVLRTGALPAGVEIVEKRIVDPTMGEDSKNSGILAVALAGIAVLIFMAAYYLLSGLIADIALVLNLVLLPLGMVLTAGFMGTFLGTRTGGNPFMLPVLTLPGIAGILLTIGMAVDANVLIFERMREEFQAGKKLWNAITAGYDRAFVTIMDANVTTLITGIILFIFGSGPIRGFAVTLCAGIMVSLFTALVVTRLLFGAITPKMHTTRLKMFSIVRQTSIDFIGKRRIAAVVSILLIALPMGYMVHRGMSDPARIFGVDFVSGSSLSLTYDTAPAVDEIRKILDNSGLPGAQIQYQEEMGGDNRYLVIKSSRGESGQIKQLLQESFPDAGFMVSTEEQVEPQVSRLLKVRAVKAIIIALVCIVIYISIRFEFGFACGAIVALIHDVLITAGIYSLCGRQLSLPIIAALLTIVGYSVNDTIVVFDRIREDLRLVKGKSFMEICNLSINQTLGRTLLTSLTTLLAVVMLLLFGGGAVNDFALALFIGVVVGTYSSVFIATPVVLLWYRGKKPDFAAGQ